MILILCSLAIFLAGGLLALLPGRPAKVTSAIGAGSAVVASVVGLVGMFFADGQTASLDWGGFGKATLGFDTLSGVFLFPVLVLVAVGAVYGVEYLKSYQKPLGPHWFFYNALAASMVGVLIARDALSFLVAWEVMALASFFLVTFENEKASVREAGWIYLVATHFASQIGRAHV